MELKIFCPCGAKYKFDVEPVDNRMPFTVKCPVCGVDGTEAANTALQQAAAAEPAAPPAPAPSATRLRVQSVETPAAAPAPVPPAPAPIPAFRPPAAQKSSGGKWKTVLTVTLACVVLAAVGFKWYRRISRLVRTAVAVGQASVSGPAADENRNLTVEDGVIVFVKHSNHLDVAQACGAFWTNKLSRGLSLVTTNGEPGWTEKEFAVLAAHNGYVRIYGDLAWDEKQFEGLTQFLSENLGTTTIEYAENDFSGAFVFGVYEGGERKVFAKKTVKVNAAKDDVDEVVTVEGKEYAMAHGFKPDPQEGWNEFDGEVITKRLGVKMWDEKEDVPVDFITLKEVRLSGPAKTSPTNAARLRPARTGAQ